MKIRIGWGIRRKVRRNKAYGKKFKMYRYNRYKKYIIPGISKIDPFASYDEDGREKMIFQRNDWK